MSIAALLLVGVATSVAAADEQPRTDKKPPPARSAAVATDWSSLPPAHRQALSPLQREWPAIDAQRRSKWLEVAARFATMPVEERKLVQARMEEWARLAPIERGRTRLQFQESLRWSPDAKEREGAWEAYQALQPEQRQALVDRSRPVAAPPAAARTDTLAAPGATAADKRTPPNTVVRPPQPVTPTTVQAKPGATTKLMSAPPPPPTHQQPGQPRITASPAFVDPLTLLPRRGPQGAAVVDTRTNANPAQ